MTGITDYIAAAFNEGRAARRSNTRTDGNAIYLFGHRIVERRANGSVWVTLAGWNTTTTRERLQPFAEFRTVGADKRRQGGQAFCNGKPVDSDSWIKVGKATRRATARA